MSDRPIPRTWNDRVVWLLEHLLGLPGGSDGLELPLGMPGSPVLHRTRVAFSGAGVATELVIQLPTTTFAWELVGFSLVRSAGSATTWAPRIGESAGFVADGIDERVTYDAGPVTTPIRDVFCEAIPARADASGRLFLRPGFSAGVDNAGTAEVWVRQAFEAL